MGMKTESREKLKETFTSFVQNLTEIPYSIEELQKAYPFHTLFFPGEAIKTFKKQRTVVTKMGQQLIPSVAEIMAKDAYRDVHREHEITEELDVAKISVVDKIINGLRMGKRKPDHEAEVQEIRRASSDETREIRVIADLYIGDFESGPLFFEIKSPLPNLDVCAESKKKMLLFQALFWDNNPQAFFALYYNPYYPKKYGHPFTKRIMDLEKEVLIGRDMWDKLGGTGAYDELIEIIDETRESLSRKPKF